jgi:hypothetical protein
MWRNYINARLGDNGNNSVFGEANGRFAPDAPPDRTVVGAGVMFDAGTSFMYKTRTLWLGHGSRSRGGLFTRLLENSDFRNLVINNLPTNENRRSSARVQQIAESVYQELLPELSEHNGRWVGNIGAPSNTYAGTSVPISCVNTCGRF